MKIAISSTLIALLVGRTKASGEGGRDGGVNTCVRENAHNCGSLMRTMMRHDALAVMASTDS
jgi:hypothetical protein